MKEAASRLCIINTSKKDFLLYVQELLTGKQEYYPSDLVYERVLIGPEADSVISQINAHWEYSNDSYWFPLMGDEPQTITDKFFIMKKFAAPYWDEICNYISNNYDRLYSYGESYYDIQFCYETSERMDMEQAEWCYTDKNFEWFIYFSHEDTVSFAGTIVPVMKEILQTEKEHWNRFEGLFTIHA